MPYQNQARSARHTVYKLLSFLLILALLAACKKEKKEPIIPPTTPPPTDSNPVATISVTLDQDHPGNTISPNFQGLSYETDLLTSDPGFLNVTNTTAIQLFKNLGTGILRIGGGTSDLIGWTGQPRTAASGVDSVTTSDVDRLAAFSKASGWPVIFGLNKSNNDVVKATDEANYVTNALGSNLYAFQSGNEPDEFSAEGLRNASYDVNAYSTEWDSYYSSIKKQMPQVQFAGPDVANNSEWVNLFVQDESENINMMDAHFYVTGPATSPYITYNDILTPAYNLPGYLNNLNNQSSLYHIPFRITECNNIWGGGKQGVSDTFAASLWALDFMWQVAELGGQGINFHGGTLRGANLFYSPILNINGKFVAMPEYYAMLAFKYASSGAKVIPVTLPTTSGYNCTAYASVDNSGAYTLTLINKELKTDIAFSFSLSKPASTAKILRLSAPSITSGTGVTFAGAQVNSDGTFAPVTNEIQAISQGTVTIKIPAASAAVVVIR